MSLLNLTCAQLGYCIPPLLTSDHTVLILLSCLGTGLLLSLTPCVLPMVPVLSSIIVGQKNKLNTQQGFLLSAVYVLCMSIAYAIVGGLVAKGGQHLQLLMQKPWVLVCFSVILALMGLSLLNIISLSWMSAGQGWRIRWFRLDKQHAYGGIFMLGAVSILVLSPCVTPAMVGILSMIGRKGDSLFGMAALFAVGFGMGGPLLLVGASAGKWLPKTGPWMVWIQRFFGVGLLLFALVLCAQALFPSIENNVVRTLPEVQSAMARAQKQHQRVILDFYATWCTSCKELKHKLERDPGWDLLHKKALWVTVDISTMNQAADEVLSTYHIDGPPTIVIFDLQGHETQRWVGMVPMGTLLAALK